MTVRGAPRIAVPSSMLCPSAIVAAPPSSLLLGLSDHVLFRLVGVRQLLVHYGSAVRVRRRRIFRKACIHLQLAIFAIFCILYRSAKWRILNSQEA